MARRKKTKGSTAAQRSANPFSFKNRFDSLKNSRLAYAGGCALIVLLAIIVYYPALNGGFVFDDGILLHDSKAILASDGLYQIWCTSELLDYWPITNTSFWIEWRLWGKNTTGYHLTNLILHVVDCILLWIVLRKLSVPGSYFAALLFAVHPVNVESVAWIAQRKNVMAMTFFLASIYCYVRMELSSNVQNQFVSRGSKWRQYASQDVLWYFAALAMFILALLSKSSVAIMPALLLLIVAWRRKLTWPDFVRMIPFCVAAAVLTGVTIYLNTYGKYAIRKIDFIDRLLQSGAVIWFYLYKAVWPFDLAFVYPQWRTSVEDFRWWIPVPAALATTYILLHYEKRGTRPILFAWCFFGIALLPVMGFTDVGFMRFTLVSDHYQHIAIIGVLTLLAAAWSIGVQRSRGMMQAAAWVAAVALVAVWTWLGVRQSGIFRDAETLYVAAIEKNRECWVAYNNLGYIYFNRGDRIISEKLFREAVRFYPNYTEANSSLGVISRERGYIQRALEYFDIALRDRPMNAEVHNNMGNALSDVDRIQEAIDHYEKAIRYKRRYSAPYNNIGTLMVKQELYSVAIPYYYAAIKYDPNFYEAFNNLGNALVIVGEPVKAEGFFKKALEIKPDFAKAYNSLGLLAKNRKSYEEARGYFAEAAQCDPAYVDAYMNGAECEEQLGRHAQSLELARFGLKAAQSAQNPKVVKEVEKFIVNILAVIKKEAAGSKNNAEEN